MYDEPEPLAAWTDEGVRDALAAGERARRLREHPALCDFVPTPAMRGEVSPPCPVVYPPSVGLRLQRRARHRLSRQRFEERLMRLDPLLWAPHGPLMPAGGTRRELSPLYDEYRTANRPFRRAFPGGEARRKTLLAVGESNARKEGQS